MSSSPRSERRLSRPAQWGLYLLYALAAVALIRAALIVPGQLQDLWELKYGVPYEGTPIPTEGEAILTGAVIEAWTGVPLGDVHLEAVRYPSGEPRAADGEPWAPSHPRKARTEADGSFRLAVAPGLYRIRVEDREYDASNGYQAVVDGRGQTPAPLIIGAHRACELEVQLVDDGGQPSPGAELFVKSGDPGRAFFTPQPYGMATTDEKGLASWRCRCGTLQIRQAQLPRERVYYIEHTIELDRDTPRQILTLAQVRAGGTEARDPVLVRRPEADTRPVLDLVPTPREGAPERVGAASLAARLVDDDGQPVRAQVMIDYLAWPTDFKYAYLRFLPQWPVTNAQGELSTPLPAGRHRLFVMPAGRAAVVLDPFDVGAGEALDLGELTVPLRAPRRATGRVEGPDGPVGGAEVYPVATGELGRLFLSALNTGPFPRTMTAPDGTFELGGLPHDEVVLMAYHRDVGAGEPVTLSLAEGDATDVTVRLERGSTDRKMGWVAGGWFEVTRDGVLAVRVIEGSPTHRAGLRPGDRLVAVDDRPARWYEKQRLFAVLGDEAPAPPVTVTVERPGEGALQVLTWAAPTPDDGEVAGATPEPD